MLSHLPKPIPLTLLKPWHKRRRQQQRNITTKFWCWNQSCFGQQWIPCWPLESTPNDHLFYISKQTITTTLDWPLKTKQNKTLTNVARSISCFTAYFCMILQSDTCMMTTCWSLVYPEMIMLFVQTNWPHSSLSSSSFFCLLRLINNGLIWIGNFILQQQQQQQLDMNSFLNSKFCLYSANAYTFDFLTNENVVERL